MKPNSLKKFNKSEENITKVVERSISDASSNRIVPEIAKWFNSFDCAVSLRFDDNFTSHIKYVVPVLNEFNFKATFMTNPGRNNLLISYNKHKKFWENEIPFMGHRLGNHTMHHRGAKNLEEAEYEIGEASKLIWKLFPNKGKLNVFAPGGGEKWNGKRWSKTDPEFKTILPKYHLIDLYNGRNNGVELNSNFPQNQWKRLIDYALAEKIHQTLIFHKVGNKNLIDFTKEVISGFNNCFPKEQFLNMVKYLDSKRSQVWVAPIVQIIKYRTEFEVAKMNFINSNELISTYELEVGTDPQLYDQELSLVTQFKKETGMLKVYQDGKEVDVHQKSNDECIINVIPKNSKIEFKIT